jgi:hypothetical protein
MSLMLNLWDCCHLFCCIVVHGVELLLLFLLQYCRLYFVMYVMAIVLKVTGTGPFVCGVMDHIFVCNEGKIRQVVGREN